MKLSATAVAAAGFSLGVLTGCADSPTSPQGARAEWTLRLDESPNITSVTVTCQPDARLHICQATATIQNGPPRDISRTTAVWTSSDLTVATVNRVGIVTPVGRGLVTITAAAGGFSGSATIVVN